VNSTVKTAVFWIVILATVVLLWQVVQSGASQEVKPYNFSTFREEVMGDNVASVTIKGEEAEGKLNSGQSFTVILPPGYPSIIDLLSEHNVTLEIEPSTSPSWLSALVTFSPILLVIVFWEVEAPSFAGEIVLEGVPETRKTHRQRVVGNVDRRVVDIRGEQHLDDRRRHDVQVGDRYAILIRQ
jgi:hypothetical protein